MNKNHKPLKKFYIKIDEKGLKFSKDMKMSNVLNTLLTYCFMICKHAGLPYAAIHDAFCAGSAEFYPDEYFPSEEELKEEMAQEDKEMAEAETVNENWQEEINATKELVKAHIEEEEADEC